MAPHAASSDDGRPFTFPPQPPSLDSDASFDNGTNGESSEPVAAGSVSAAEKTYEPIAICGMACRLPGGINSPAELWDFLLAKGDAKSRVPESRFSIDAYLSDNGKPGTTNCPYGYFLDNDLTTLDASFFTMSPKELERCDPQQRQMLEVSREVLEDAGETDWRGKKIGVFMGNFGEDWLDMLERDPQQYSPYSLTGYVDFNLSNRVSYEMDLQGPRYERKALRSMESLGADNSKQYDD